MASEMYQQAMANVNANASRNQPQPTHISPLSGQSRNPTSSPSKVPQYLTADQEKAALRRYEEAKMAVDRVHNNSTGQAPIAYDSLYPRVGGSSSATALSDAPPSFEASVSSADTVTGPMSAAQEKAALAERMRAVDAQQSSQFSPPPPAFDVTTASSPGPTSNPAPGQKEYLDAAAEKEALRKKFEARDAATSRKKSTKATAIPPRNASLTAGTRPTPTPPSSGPISNANAVLSAAEEKAMLKAKLEARDARAQKKGGVNGHVPASPGNQPMTPPPTSPSPAASFAHLQHRYSPAMPNAALSPSPMPGTPPPLMPRPPVEYIQETQEEDARVSKIAIDGANVPLDGPGSGVYMNGHVHGQSGVIKAPGPPPPLPPKPAGE